MSEADTSTEQLSGIDCSDSGGGVVVVVDGGAVVGVVLLAPLFDVVGGAVVGVVFSAVGNVVVVVDVGIVVDVVDEGTVVGETGLLEAVSSPFAAPGGDVEGADPLAEGPDFAAAWTAELTRSDAPAKPEVATKATTARAVVTGRTTRMIDRGNRGRFPRSPRRLRPAYIAPPLRGRA